MSECEYERGNKAGLLKGLQPEKTFLGKKVYFNELIRLTRSKKPAVTVVGGKGGF